MAHKGLFLTVCCDAGGSFIYAPVFPLGSSRTSAGRWQMAYSRN